jgi:hypothetical protein
MKFCAQGVLKVKLSKKIFSCHFYHSYPRCQNTKMYVLHKVTSD